MNVPHLIQYQGSKRLLAPKIAQYFPDKFNRIVEPFSGTAALTLYAAAAGKADKFLLNDINQPLIDMLQMCIDDPEHLADLYEELWNGQFQEGEDNLSWFFKQRELFNEEHKPEQLLFLLARMVKGAIRYNSEGKLNQSCDKRRYGTKPQAVRRNARNIAALLQGKTELISEDYRYVLHCMLQKGDLLYLDPPYQGTATSHNPRYCSAIDFDQFIRELYLLNRKGVDYILSFDGTTGGKVHGKPLPEGLKLHKIDLYAGKSAQATLSGRSENTVESLYLSPSLVKKLEKQNPARLAS